MTNGKLYGPTISLTVNFLAPAKTGLMTSEAKVTQLGKSIAFVEGKLTTDDGMLLATATASVRLVEAVKALSPQRAK
jgi:acyl-coenzyme A thioesterase PaaI-like protein